MASRSLAKSPYVSVIADNPETIKGLCVYLSQAGIALHPTRDLRAASTLPLAVNVVVLFPDEYDVGEAVASIAALRGSRPRLRILIVTSNPQSFHAALAQDCRSLPVILLPKPAFSWTILDAIRAHGHSDEP